MDLTGAVSQAAVPTEAGIQTYFDTVNRKGGVNGHPIKYRSHDGQTNPDQDFTAAQQVVSSNPIAIFSQTSSGGFQKLLSVFGGTETPWITLSATDAQTYPPISNVFQIGLTPRQHAELLITQAKTLLNGDLSGKKLAFVGSETPFTQSIFADANTLARGAGGTVVTSQIAALGAPSFTAQASVVAQDKPDAVIVAAIGNDTVTIALALIAAGVDVPLISYSGGVTPPVFKKISSSHYYSYSEFALPQFDAGLLAQATSYGVAAQANASLYFTSGWVFAAVLVQGLEKCGDACHPASLTDALNHTSNFDVPLGATFGPIALSKTDHAGITAAQFYKWDSTNSTVVPAGDPVALKK